MTQRDHSVKEREGDSWRARDTFIFGGSLCLWKIHSYKNMYVAIARRAEDKY